MSVILADLPDERPRITGVKGEYDVGDGIKASCTSWQSHPPANLSWFINGEPVCQNMLLKFEPMEGLVRDLARSTNVDQRTGQFKK